MTENQRITEEQRVIDLIEIENKLYTFLDEYKIPRDSVLRNAWCIIYTYLHTDIHFEN